MSWYTQTLYGEERVKGNILRKVNLLINNINADKHMENDYDTIIDGLLLGNKYAAQDPTCVNNMGVTRIINVTDTVPNVFNTVKYYTYPIKDVDICTTPTYQTLEIFNNSADIIHDALRRNETILVHCKRGHHRSAAVVAFYLTKYHNKTLLEAMYIIKNKRSTTFSRLTCMTSVLIDYEAEKLLDKQ
jgi:hypothetical protein